MLWCGYCSVSFKSFVLRHLLGVSLCCGNHCWFAFVLWCGFCFVSFQSFAKRHLVIALSSATPRNQYLDVTSLEKREAQ